MDFTIIFTVAIVIFLAELPDKSLFASLILGSRFPGFYVWLGAAAAFSVHVTVAVLAGHLLTLLPHTILKIVIAALFLAGSAILFFTKQSPTAEVDEEKKLADKQAATKWKVVATSFSVVFVGEWGDITQIATANYAAKYHDTIHVAIGALIGLWTVTALAIAVGSKALTLIPPKVLQRTTATILFVFGIFSLFQAFH
jgi:putative Ca2+/H+ antiporter (TMEM165/GDT1 family)